MSIPSAFGVVLIGFIVLGLIDWLWLRRRRRQKLPEPVLDERDWLAAFYREHHP